MSCCTVDTSFITPQEVASVTDHTFLKTEDAFSNHELGSVSGRKRELDKFLEGVPGVKPYAVCVRHYDVGCAVSRLESLGMRNVKVAAVVGFPNPDAYVNRRTSHASVREEIMWAENQGAREIDFVLPSIGRNNHEEVSSYASLIAQTTRDLRLTSKMIIETGERTNEHIVQACNLASKTGINFVKTSTGYSRKGATKEALELMREHFKGGIKISGGVTPENYIGFLELVASTHGRPGYIELDPSLVRIGASSLLPALYSASISAVQRSCEKDY